MATATAKAQITDIGQLIVCDPKIRNGWACVAGTATSVHRISARYNMGSSVEEIAEQLDHLSLTQVLAALTYYFANKEVIDAELAEYEAESDRIEREYLLSKGYSHENLPMSG